MTEKNLFNLNREKENYNANAIEVLEGLEPVRKRPGMYIGGTDERAMHHLVSEVLDNAMDEAVAGYASKIEVTINNDFSVSIIDNGRGIPVDPHPKFPKKSALEVILTTLHAGGKFSGDSYQTSGGLHGVGISVVNALSTELKVEVIRNHNVFRQSFSRGVTISTLETGETVKKRSGTKVTFIPDPQIFGDNKRFKPIKIFEIARSKAFLFSGVEIKWKCAEQCLEKDDNSIPFEARFHFPGGLTDFLKESLQSIQTYSAHAFSGKIIFSEKFKNSTAGSVEWAINWTPQRDGFVSSYCNTILTSDGGTHEIGFWAAILKGIKSFADLVGSKKSSQITKEDLLSGGCALISVFVREPEFVGQTKDRLATSEVSKLVELSIKQKLQILF